MEQATHAAATADTAPQREARRGGPERVAWPRAVLLAVIGLGCGASALAEGFYDLTAWGPIAVGVFALLTGLVLGAPARPRGAAAIALGALVFLFAWSWLSTAWAESNDQAMGMAGRWALYAALLGALLLLLRRRADYFVLLAVLCAGVLLTAGYVVVTMIAGDGPLLFIGGRLVEPLGYVNGEAGLFLLGLWPLVAVGEKTRSPLLSGAAMAGAFVVAAMLVLGQTRGVLPGVVVSAIVLLAVVPGRARRLSALIVIGAGLALISEPLLDVYSETPGRSEVIPPAYEETVREAGRLIPLAAAAVGLLWAAAQAVLSRAANRSPTAARTIPRVEGAIGVALVVIAGAAALGAVDDPVGKVERQYDQFVNLRVDQPRGSSRFFTGGGYRYDYWRVAWLEFRDRPLEGVGAGNYDRMYFRERRTSEDIRQPHSLELQTLGELGLVGGAALAAFVIAVLAGLLRACGRARRDPTVRLVAVAAGGSFVGWLVHTSVDWLHLVPGVTGIALSGAAMLLAPWMLPVRGRFGARRVAATVVVLAATAAAALAVGRMAASEYLLQEGRDELTSDPPEALRLANESLELNDDALSTLYLKSAAYARLGNYPKARAALLEATRVKPHDSLPWALLGDLAVRRRELRRARGYYRRASRLNPRSFQFEQLAADPRGALRGRGN